MANPTITSNGGGLLLGVNLAGAEFGTPNHVPGVFGTDYIYPTHTEIDYYAAKGMSVVRLPFLWERLQHSENGPLDGAELARLDDVVSYTTGKGLKIEIEPHNYGYGFGALILLCHKFWCPFRAAQHGQRESVVARAATNLRRIVAIEFGTWRSGRNGGSSGLVTFA